VISTRNTRPSTGVSSRKCSTRRAPGPNVPAARCAIAPPGRSALDRYTPPAPPKHRAWADAFADKNIRLGGGR
jgi:hypothetical protein